MKFDRPVIEQLFNKWRKDRTFADESILDAAWREQLQMWGILTEEEQQTKDEHTLAKARAAKDELRESGLSDAPRFGTCKRKGCQNRKVESLLLRGFCPSCRGVTVKQTIASGGRFDAAKPHLLDATTSELVTSLIVFTNKKKSHPDVLKLTTEERRRLVLEAKKNNPSATEREIAKETKLPRSMVNHILKNSLVNFKPEKPENSEDVKQFLRERAERQPLLRTDAKRYLETRARRS